MVFVNDMKEIKTYTQELLNKAKIYLSKEYHLDALNLSDFQAINFYLIDQAINNEKNLFIKSFDKELPAISQFPAVLSVAISLFFKNFCDDISTIKPGVVIQDTTTGERFVYLKSNGNEHIISNKVKKKYPNTKQLKKYIIVDVSLKNSIPRARITSYRKLYDLIFNIKKVPSQFKYKSAIIMSKKEFDDEIRTQKYIDINVKKAIPMRWISRTGSESWNYIPIEPMIYCVPDYETLQTYIFDKGIEIETLVVIGKNKYKDETSIKIRLALRNEEILNCIVLGIEDFNDEQKQFLKWKWTFPEFQYLENKEAGNIKVIRVNDFSYQEKIENFIEYLTSIEKEYEISLINVKRLRRFLYALVLSKKENSRTLSQLEFLQHLLKKVSSETIEQDFYDLEIDDTKVQQEIKKLIDSIFENFNNNKLNYLEHLKIINYLIVPKRLVENWKEEFKGNCHKIYSFSEFKAIQNKINGSQIIHVLSIYNNGKYFDEVLDFAINSNHQFTFLSYPEEAKVIKTYLDKYNSSLATEYQSKDRKKLTGLEYKTIIKQVVTTKSLTDIMDGFYQQNNGNSKVYDYESHKQINYRINFQGNSESLVYDGSKTILINKNGNWIKSKTYNVLPGDVVRVYNNLSKERLFTIALKEDKDGRFQEVENMSAIWKKALSNYFSNKIEQDKYYNREQLLNSLQVKGSKITNVVTITKWLNKDDKERFPSRDIELKAMKLLFNDEELNLIFLELLRVKRFYRGLMISLGRDLSDDVMDYIISGGKNKGKMLSKFKTEEINSFVKSAAPERTITSKAITEDEESN